MHMLPQSRTIAAQDRGPQAGLSLPALAPNSARSGLLAVSPARCMGTFRASATPPTSCFLIHRSSMRLGTLLLSATSYLQRLPARSVAPAAVWPMPPQARSRGSDMLAERPPAPCKAPTGIRGLDEITGGGLPRGRPTLICGGAGCGKTCSPWSSSSVARRSSTSPAFSWLRGDRRRSLPRTSARWAST